MRAALLFVLLCFVTTAVATPQGVADRKLLGTKASPAKASPKPSPPHPPSPHPPSPPPADIDVDASTINAALDTLTTQVTQLSAGLALTTPPVCCLEHTVLIAGTAGTTWNTVNGVPAMFFDTLGWRCICKDPSWGNMDCCAHVGP